MTPNGSPGSDTSSSVERVQANSVLGSPFFLIPTLLLILALVGSQLLGTDHPQEDILSTPATLPIYQTTLPRPPPQELVELLDLGLNGAVAYAIDGGVGVLDLATGEVSPVTDMSDLAVPGDFAVLRTETGNFVINQVEPTNVGLSEIQGDIVSTSASQRFVAVLFGGVNGGDPETDVRYAFTLSGSYGVKATDVGLVSTSEIEREAKHFLVPGLGAVFEGPRGGSFIFDANGYQRISDYRVRAAAVGSRVEVRCEDDQGCVPYFVSADEDFELPDVFARDVELSMSPDGQWILLNVIQPAPGPTSLWQGGGAQLYDVSSRQLHPLGVAGPGSPHWASDSSFVGWLEPTPDSTELVIAFTADRTWVTIDLVPLGAPQRSGDELVFIRG
jgi:hypothetical protein